MVLNDWRADLHCHSTCSDGTASPLQLLELAHALGLQGLSITDHDTVAAYSSEVEEAAQRQGIQLLPGVEFSAERKGHSIHILGYSFLPSSPIIIDFCHRHALRRYQRAVAIVARLKTLGISIEMERLPKDLIGRPHIALALMEMGVVSSVEEAFKIYLGKGGKAYLETDSFSVEETLEVIHAAGGLAVIAHPHLVKNRKIIEELVALSFDGIEGYYGRFPLHANRPWLALAEKKGLLITGGSDFHGQVKPDSVLGSSWVDLARFTPLWEHYRQHSNSC